MLTIKFSSELYEQKPSRLRLTSTPNIRYTTTVLFICSQSCRLQNRSQRDCSEINAIVGITSRSENTTYVFHYRWALIGVLGSIEPYISGARKFWTTLKSRFVNFGFIDSNGVYLHHHVYAMPTLLEHFSNEHILSPLPDPITTSTIRAVNVVNSPPEAPPGIFSVHMNLLGNSSTCFHSLRHQSLVQWLGYCECEFPESRVGSSQ